MRSHHRVEYAPNTSRALVGRGRRRRAALVAALLLSAAVPLWLASAAPAAVDFSSPTSYAVGERPRVVVAGDLSGDGKLDLAFSVGGANGLSILRGDGSGGFGPPRNDWRNAGR